MAQTGYGAPMAGEIFISYRRADVAWAKLLHAQLQAEGVEAWYDALVGAGTVLTLLRPQPRRSLRQTLRAGISPFTIRRPTR